jgi:hypothetical protein
MNRSVRNGSAKQQAILATLPVAAIAALLIALVQP